MKKFLCFTALFIAGCSPVVVPVSSVVVDPAVAVISASMDSVEKQDADKLYTIFSGLSLYVSQTEKVDTTLKVVQLCGLVETDFNYSKGKYTVFTDAVEKFLSDKGYKKVKKIVAIVTDDTKEMARSSIVSDLNVIAQAAKSIRDRVEKK